MLFLAIMNNLPETIGLVFWTGFVFWGGRRWERRFGAKFFRRG